MTRPKKMGWGHGANAENDSDSEFMAMFLPSRSADIAAAKCCFVFFHAFLQREKKKRDTPIDACR